MLRNLLVLCVLALALGCGAKTVSERNLPADKPTVDPKVTALIDADSEGMALLKAGKKSEAMKKFREGLDQYRDTKATDHSPEMAMAMAVIYQRIIAIVGRSLDEKTALTWIEHCHTFARRGGINEDDLLKWGNKIVLETVEAQNTKK